MVGQLFIPVTAQGAPQWGSVGDSDFYAYRFGLDTHCWFAYHLNHDYRLNSPIRLHVHWLADGSDANTVRWTVQYVYAKGHNQGTFDFGDGTGTTQEFEEASPNAFRHMTTLMPLGIDNTDFEPDGILWVKVSRVSNGGTDNQDNVFVLTADAHYQANDARATKNRLLPFS